MASTEGTPLRVLIVHVWFWPHVGGGDQHVEMLGRELVKLGHEVTVWCADVPEHDSKHFQRGAINVVRLSPSRILAGVAGLLPKLNSIDVMVRTCKSLCQR